MYGDKVKKLVLTFSLCSVPYVSVANSMVEMYDLNILGASVGQFIYGIVILLFFLSLLKSNRLIFEALRNFKVMTIFIYILFSLSLLHAVDGYQIGIHSDIFVNNITFLLKAVFLYIVYAYSYALWRSCLINENWLIKISIFILLSIVSMQVIAKIIGFSNNQYEGIFVFGGLNKSASITAAQLVSLMPAFLFLTDKVRYISLYTSINLMFTLMTFRRSAIIAAIFVVAFSLLYQFERREVKKKTTAIVISIICSVIFIVVSSLGSELRERFIDLNIFSEGTGSGRTIIWAIALEYIYERTLFSNIFGEGLGTIGRILEADFGNSIGAHNDWLEMFVAFGLIGFISFGAIFLSLTYFLFLEIKRKKNSISLSLFSILIILWIISLATGGTIDPSFSIIFCMIGVLKAQSMIRLQKKH